MNTKNTKTEKAKHESQHDMANQASGSASQPAGAVDSQASETLPAPVEPTSPVKADSGISALLRAYGDDITLPRIQLVGSNSELVRTFPPGSWVYNRSIQIAAPNESLRVIVLGIGPKAWSYRGAGSESLLAFHVEDVKSLGGTTSYAEAQRNPQLKFFRAFAPVYLLVELTVEQQERVHSDLQFDGNRYLIGSLTIGGTSYKQVRRLLTERAFGVLYTGWYSRYWKLTGVSRQFKTVWAWVPEFLLADRVPQALQAQIAKIVEALQFQLGAAQKLPDDTSVVDVKSAEDDNLEM